MKCKCRTCGSLYKEAKSTADYKGYCSQGCLHLKSRELGFRRRNPRPFGVGDTEYQILKQNNQIGSIPVSE